MKKFIAIVLTAILIFSVIPASAYSLFNSYRNGDVDRSGKLKIQDANLIQRSLANMVTLDDEQRYLADFDLNGKVNILDVTEIQLVLAEIKQPPVEPDTAATQATEATAPNPQVNSMVKIGFTNNKNWSTVNFYIYNSSTGTPQKQWPGTTMTPAYTNDGGEKVYTATVDTSKYDRIIFNNGTAQTVNIPLNKASSGYYISDVSNSKAMLVGTYALTGADKGNMTKLKFDYNDGTNTYKKRVWIWTPADYKATGEKFRTIYMTDGQNLFDDDHEDEHGGWEVTDAVESMMANGGRGVIIVGIESTGTRRDTELTPNLGTINPLIPSSEAQSYKNGKGIQFADFVANTVMPYVQQNYNSSTAKCDNMIAGSSSGGIESFYIGMEYNDKFGMIGALSPAFLLFGDSVWNSYLSKFDLASADMPKLYLFNGNNEDDSLEQNLYTFCVEMYNRLTTAKYKNMTFTIEEEFKHNEAYWRVIFPECISWCLGI